MVRFGEIEARFCVCLEVFGSTKIEQQFVEIGTQFCR